MGANSLCNVRLVDLFSTQSFGCPNDGDTRTGEVLLSWLANWCIFLESRRITEMASLDMSLRSFQLPLDTC